MSHNADKDDMLSQAAWNPNRPFNSLPTLPPAVEIESKQVLRACIPARAALAELKQAAGLIPNPTVLINTLPLLEARASSEIENIVTTTDRLFRHLSTEGDADPATREALRYRTALLEGARALHDRPLTTRTAEIICSRIKGVEMQVRRVPGTALAEIGSGRVIYTPPEGEARLRELLADWERFIHADSPVDPLIRLAVGHYQFEAIHPFTDGNGRTGRVINSLYLVEQGLLPEPILYLSRYIIGRKDEYYRSLLAVTRDAAWESWILYVLRGIEETAAWTTARIAAIRELADETARYVQQVRPRIYTRELIDALFEQPYCRIGNIVEKGLVERQAASRHLHALAEVGVLEVQQVGRERLFINIRMMQLLTRESLETSPF